MTNFKEQRTLRDQLAADRTKLANQRTLLAMFRTGLYFEVMGLTVITLEKLQALRKFAPLLFLAGAAIMLLGLLNYIRMNKRVSKAYADFPK